MPWSVKKQDGKFCVIKDEDGSVVKCHATKAMAVAQQKALYASEAKEVEPLTEKGLIAGPGIPDGTGPGCADITGIGGAISFADLRAAEQAREYAGEVEELSYQFSALATNIMNRPDVEDKAAALEALATEFTGLVRNPPDETKEVDEDDATLFKRFKDWVKATPMKTEGGKKFPASDYLVVEDPQSPDTWHLQIKRNGKPDRGLAGAAWAALFSPGGHRGNKYAGPGKEAAGKKLRALYSSEGWELPGGNKEAMMLWKEADGIIHWLARYSNNRRDGDNPPEIISAESHQRFDEMLSKGAVPMPELWLWHRPEWKWGITTWHAYDDAGFSIAGGVVDKGKEFLAEHLMALDPALVRVSHGMPTSSIARDPDDESVIVEHITREISPLPAWAAANQMTGFSILKEVQMSIPQEKRDALKDEWNLSDELLTQLEAANAADAKEADEAGIETKEVETETTTEAVTPAAETVSTEPVVESSAEPGVSREEMREALLTIGQAIAALTEQVKELQGGVAEVKEARAVEEAETLSEIFQRAIGHPAARVDGRTTEAKDRPKETKVAPDAVVNSGHPLADSIINSIVSGEWAQQFAQPEQ